MELRETGKAGAAAVLLWPDDGLDAAVFASVVRSLGKSCRVLVPVVAPEEPPDARVAAVESALLAGYDGRIWGAYGLRGGGSALLSLLAEGKVRVRTSVVEGAVEVPAQGLREFSGTLFHWKGSKDKGAGKSWEALHKAFPALRSLTLRKLKAGQDVVSIRPDIMTKRLLKAFGSAGHGPCEHARAAQRLVRLAAAQPPPGGKGARMAPDDAAAPPHRRGSDADHRGRGKGRSALEPHDPRGALRGVRRGVRRSGGDLRRSAYSGCDARCGNLSESGTEEQKPPNEKRVTDYKKIGNRCTVSDFFAKFVHLPIECSALVDYNHQCMINNKHT